MLLTSITCGVLIAVALVTTGTTADQCSMSSKEIDGNWYCMPVQAIRYTNVGTAGTYNQITDMRSDGQCFSVPKHFSGPISPLDEELSIHVRGPTHLKQFAAYVPSTAADAVAKRKDLERKDVGYAHRHIHRRAVRRQKHLHQEKRQIISADIFGHEVSWANNYFGPSSTTEVEVVATIEGAVVSWTNNYHPEETASPQPAQVASAIVNNAAPAAGIQPTPTAAQASTGNPSEKSSSVYERIGFYDSAAQILDNLVFLANHGGQGSGCWDEVYGNSLSYVDSAGAGGASSPQILADQTIPSGAEVIIMLDQKCEGNDCGYYRPDSVAYHGFDGADKIFLFAFTMPMDGATAFEGDQPAIWALNAQIPRTVQYGNGGCNCWTSGCGEFDIAEALDAGSSYLKSTLHTNTPAGDSDWIMRPTNGTLKLAVIFSGSQSTVHIQVLPYDTDFPETMTGGDIDRLCSAVSSNHVSLFAVS